MSYKKNKRKESNKKMQGWTISQTLDGETKNGFTIENTIEGKRVTNNKGYVYKRKFKKIETARKFAESKMKD